MELFTVLFDSLLKMSPIIGLLCVAIYYLYTQNNDLKKDVKELNEYIRDESVKNVQILASVSNTLDKVINNNNDNATRLKEWLTLKFDNLKNE